MHIYRVLTENAGDAISISVQFSVEALAHVQHWQKEKEKQMATDITHRFGTKVLYFSTALEVLA